MCTETSFLRWAPSLERWLVSAVHKLKKVGLQVLFNSTSSSRCCSRSSVVVVEVVVEVVLFVCLFGFYRLSNHTSDCNETFTSCTLQSALGFCDVFKKKSDVRLAISGQKTSFLVFIYVK